MCACTGVVDADGVFGLGVKAGGRVSDDGGCGNGFEFQFGGALICDGDGDPGDKAVEGGRVDDVGGECGFGSGGGGFPSQSVRLVFGKGAWGGFVFGVAERFYFCFAVEAEVDFLFDPAGAMAAEWGGKADRDGQ